MLGYTGADIARRLGGGFMASCGAEGEGGCGVCEARECQGRGAAAVQGGWHAIESYGLITEVAHRISVATPLLQKRAT